MPRPRFDNLRPEKRERILGAAAREFAAHGFERASLNQILKEARISKGAAYYYFDDKADLFATVVKHYTDLLMGDAVPVIEQLEAKTFWPRLTELYWRQFQYYSEEPWAFGVVKAAARLSPELLERTSLADYLGQMENWLGALLQKGQALGVVRTDLPNSLLYELFTAVDDASDQWLLAHWQELEMAEIKEIVHRVMDAMQHLLMPPTEGD
jgi:AcrR family transcriptional regulator